MPAADSLIVGGTMHTLDPTHPVASEIAIKDGLIVAVDDVRDWRGASTVVHDLDGGVLTPGLVDGHQHPVHGSANFTGLDFGDCRSLDDIRAVVAAGLRSLDRGQWLTGHGLIHDAFEGRPISHVWFDDLLEGVPALFTFFDAHSALASPAALAVANIDGPRDFPSNSSIVCDDAGRPTGHLLEFGALALVRAVVPAPDLQSRRVRLRELLSAMAATGLTGAHVMDAEDGALDLLAGMEDLPIRLRIAPWAMPGIGADEIDRLIDLRSVGGHRWSVDAVKFFLDGTVEGGTAWLEHADCHGGGTRSFWDHPEEYTEAVRRLASAGLQTVTHAIGDAAVSHALDALEGLDAPVPQRIEHIESAPDDVIARIARLGVVASMQPTHATYTKADHSDEWSMRLGSERASRGWRIRDLREAGATVILGSDWPVSHYDPRAVLAAAQLRRLPGTDDAPINLHQALTARMALEGMTSHAARGTGLGHIAGRIAPGYRADLTAFSVDPLIAPPDELADAPIAFTMVDGERIGQPVRRSNPADRAER